MRHVRTFSALALVALAAGCEQAVTPPEQRVPQEPQASEIGTGYILTPSGEPMQITYDVVDGAACWQGDMCLGPASEIARTPGAALARRQAPTGSGPRLGVYLTSGGRWPRGVIPYVVDPNLPDQARVTAAVNDLNAKTGLRVKPRTDESVWVYITPTKSSSDASRVSNTGRTGRDTIYLNYASPWQTLVHEFGHEAGLGHEISRCDRDNYVNILWDNVKPGYAGNFNLLCAGQGYTTTSAGYAPYDKNSIMHYGPTQFGIDGKVTVQMKDGTPITTLGQRSGITPNDHRTIRAIYPNDARFVGYQNVPATMRAGQHYTVTVVMENTGQGWWKPDQAFRLGAQNPQDNSTWGTARAFLPGEIGPGEWAYITFQVRAPSVSGQYNFQWGMLKEWSYWFGGHSTNQVINVVY